MFGKETGSPERRLEAILAAKEERWARKLSLAASLNAGNLAGAVSLAVLTLRLPGPLRTSPGYVETALSLHLSFARTLRERGIPLLREDFLIGGDGPESYIAAGLEPVELKRLSLAWELSHPWGDLADLDIMDSTGSPVNRADLGYPGRSCLVCGEEAFLCVKERRHGIGTIEARIEAILERPEDDKSATDRWVGGLALAATLMEVSAHPKPGLVSPQSRGAHSDMDYATFLESAAAICPWFAEFARLGRLSKADAALLPELRRAGLSAERDMFAATDGVNTHKGLIFSMGLLCAAAGRLLADEAEIDPDSCASLASSLAAGICAGDFSGLGGKGRRATTMGEKLHLQYGLRGIRGEAEDGFPSVLGTALPRLRAGLSAGLSDNDAMVDALLALFAVVEDTNVVGRSGLEGLSFLRSEASLALARGGMAGPKGREAVEALDKALKERNISPGGCADLLAVTVFLGSLGSPDPAASAPDCCLMRGPVLPSP
jgi:holo-ACP synthase/triphosphoribosyl-dephospho-CoA synthase